MELGSILSSIFKGNGIPKEQQIQAEVAEEQDNQNVTELQEQEADGKRDNQQPQEKVEIEKQTNEIAEDEEESLEELERKKIELDKKYEERKASTDKRVQELEEKVKEYERIQKYNEITKLLSDKKLDVRFADYIVVDTIEEAEKRIDTLMVLFNEAVKIEVKKRIPVMDPRTSTVNYGLNRLEMDQLEKDILKKAFNGEGRL